MSVFSKLFTRTPRLKEMIEPGYLTLMDEAKDRFHAAVVAEQGQRELELDDLRFCDPDQQWPAGIKADRDGENRPCLVVDRTNPLVHQVVNEQRQSRPQPQVNPTGDGATKETAEILQGMIRHIAYQSSGDTAIDTSFESMVRCGRGYFRVLTEYSDDATDDQNIVIKRVPNLHTVYLDPSFTEPDGSDADWGFVLSWLSRTAFLAEYPESKMATMDTAQWSSIGDEVPEWAQKDGSGCLVVEYFKRVRKVKKLKNRDSVQVEVQWYKMNAVEVLEKTTWPGKYIPIVPVLGTELILDGKTQWAGLIRSAKDPQRAYNYWKSAQAETIALAPRAPWVGPKGFMGNMRAAWGLANKKSIGVLEYEAFDSQNRQLPPPTRTMVEPPIQAITQAMVGAVDDLKATTGMYDPSLGNREQAQSGVAIRQLQRQGQSGNFHYQDNLARSIRHLGRILIDLIPKVYDSERVVRIIKPDETTDLVTVNGPTDQIDPETGMQRVYKLDVGTYDVTVNVGPSYQTKRQENLAFLESLMQGPMGQLMTTVAPDLVVSMTDFAISPELQERLKKTVPPQILSDPKNPQGTQQPQIPPQMQQQLQALMQQHEQLTQALHAAQDQIEQQAVKASQEMEKAKLDSSTKLQIAQMDNEAKILIAEAQIAGNGALPELQQELAELKQQQEDLANLALAHHQALSAPPSDGTEEMEPEPEEEPVAGPVQPLNPIHHILEQHGAALASIGKALHRLGGPKKIINDAEGNPIGVAPDDGEE